MGGVLVSVLNSLHFCIYCPNSDNEIRVSQMSILIIKVFAKLVALNETFAITYFIVNQINKTIIRYQNLSLAIRMI